MPNRDDNQKNRGKVSAPAGGLNDPSQAAGFGSQMSVLLQQYRDTMATIREQRANTFGDYKTQQGSIEQAGIEELGGTQRSLVDIGQYGGSASSEMLERVQANTRSQLDAARFAKLQALGALKAQALSARTDLQVGAINVQQQRAAAKAMAETQRLLEGWYDEGTSGGGGGGGGGTGGGGGGEGGGGGGLPPKVQTKLSNQTRHIDVLVEGINSAGPGGGAYSALIDQVQQLWENRNKLRKNNGLDPINIEKLWDAIDSQSAIDTGGGAGGVKAQRSTGPTTNMITGMRSQGKGKMSRGWGA